MRRYRADVRPSDRDAAVAVTPDSKSLTLSADALACPGALEGLAAHQAGSGLRLVHPFRHKLGAIVRERIGGPGGRSGKVDIRHGNEPSLAPADASEQRQSGMGRRISAFHAQLEQTEIELWSRVRLVAFFKPHRAITDRLSPFNALPP